MGLDQRKEMQDFCILDQFIVRDTSTKKDTDESSLILDYSKEVEIQKKI